jgi:threonine dehydrogenase-like Zn-dependent dehydrogenase
MLAVRMAQTARSRTLGVIGCGAIGLTSALVAQRAGFSARIYTKALPPDVYSMSAAGIWTRSSRFCDAQHASTQATRWEEMARRSYGTYQSLLGLPGNPIK